MSTRPSTTEQSIIYNMRFKLLLPLKLCTIRSGISRKNLSNATKQHDWRIFADFAQILTEQAQELHQNDSAPVNINATVYALDASTINLCLSLFPWLLFAKKAAVKPHTLLIIK